MLGVLQRNEVGSEELVDQSLSMESDLGSNILSVDLYLSIEKQREDKNEALNRDLPAPELASLASESEHIFNKALFDGVNEVLDELRPYGRRG